MVETREKKTRWIRLGIKLVIGTLVEIFTGAAVNSLLSGVKCGKIEKISAKAGGALTGLYISDKVSNYVCDTFDEAISDISNIDRADDEEDEE